MYFNFVFSRNNKNSNRYKLCAIAICSFRAKLIKEGFANQIYTTCNTTVNPSTKMGGILSNASHSGKLRRVLNCVVIFLIRILCSCSSCYWCSSWCCWYYWYYWWWCSCSSCWYCFYWWVVIK